MSATWEPDPAWSALPRGGGGPATAGLWRGRIGGTDAIIKRLRCPDPGEESYLLDPAHAGYWRREADVALHEEVLGTGLVPAPVLRVDEDDQGITLATVEIDTPPPPTLFIARALGRFAAAGFTEVPWMARRTLTDRLALAEGRGGWPTLERTTLADAAAHLWRERRHWLEKAATAPLGRVHGDVVPANVVASQGQDAVAIDWQGFGVAPIGTDLGYLALSAREDFDVLLEAFLGGVHTVRDDVDPAAVRTAASVMTVYTVLSRAEWALSRVAPGEGALAGKFGHPAVAPHLRLLQRQFPVLESLLG